MVRYTQLSASMTGKSHMIVQFLYCSSDEELDAFVDFNVLFATDVSGLELVIAH